MINFKVHVEPVPVGSMAVAIGARQKFFIILSLCIRQLNMYPFKLQILFPGSPWSFCDSSSSVCL